MKIEKRVFYLDDIENNYKMDNLKANLKYIYQDIAECEEYIKRCKAALDRSYKQAQRILETKINTVIRVKRVHYPYSSDKKIYHKVWVFQYPDVEGGKEIYPGYNNYSLTKYDKKFAGREKNKAIEYAQELKRLFNAVEIEYIDYKTR